MKAYRAVFSILLAGVLAGTWFAGSGTTASGPPSWPRTPPVPQRR
jgi:hypothetical protein